MIERKWGRLSGSEGYTSDFDKFLKTQNIRLVRSPSVRNGEVEKGETLIVYKMQFPNEVSHDSVRGICPTWPLPALETGTNIPCIQIHK